MRWDISSGCKRVGGMRSGPMCSYEWRIAITCTVCILLHTTMLHDRRHERSHTSQVIKAVENHINLDLTVEKRARKDLEAKMLK